MFGVLPGDMVAKARVSFCLSGSEPLCACYIIYTYRVNRVALRLVGRSGEPLVH